MEPKKFPTIKALFSESWLSFKNSLMNLILLNVFTFIFDVISIFLFMIWFSLILYMLDSPKINTFNDVVNKLFSSPLASVFLIISLLFLIAFLVINFGSRVASVIIVSKHEEKLNIFSAFKQSFKYFLPLVLIAFINLFFTFGGLFLFVIPGLLIAYFISFSGLEVIVAGKKPWQAIKGSLRIVSSHFGEILIRSLIYFFATFTINLLPRLFMKSDPSLAIILYIYFVVINYLVGFFGLNYTITLYKQAKSATDENKKSSPVWMIIVSLIGWLIAGLIIALLVKNADSEAVSAFKKGFDSSYNSNRTLDSNFTYDLQNDLSKKIIAYREKNSLSAMKVDGNLCAYAQRRLEQQAKGYDDYRGFIEDSANKDLMQAYFGNYRYANTTTWTPVLSDDTADEILNVWTTGNFTDPNHGIISNPDYTKFCVRANAKALVIVGVAE